MEVDIEFEMREEDLNPYLDTHPLEDRDFSTSGSWT